MHKSSQKVVIIFKWLKLDKLRITYIPYKVTGLKPIIMLRPV